MPEEQVIPAEEQEQAAASSTEDTTATESAPGDSNEPAEGEAKAKGGFQRRIDKLTREKADAARETEYWRQQALRTSPAETKVETPVKAEDKPKVDDFATHAEYVEALTDWKVETRFKAVEAKQNEEKAKTHQQTVQSSFKEKQESFKAATPDFDEVVADADIPVSKALIDEVVTHEHGPALQYFLAKNPDEAERLSKLTPLALAREVGRLESRFVTAPSKPTDKVTKAPAPPTPVSRSSSTSTKKPEDMPLAEYLAHRAKTYPNLR